MSACGAFLPLAAADRARCSASPQLQHDLDSMRAEFAKTLGEVEHERDELKAEVVRLREQVRPGRERRPAGRRRSTGVPAASKRGGPAPLILACHDRCAQVASQQRLMASHAELYEEVRQARMAHAMSVHAQLQPQSNPTMAPSAALSMI